MRSLCLGEPKLSIWEELDRQRYEKDHRSADAKLFNLPMSAQGPTYFRWSTVGAGTTQITVGLFLDYGTGCGGGAQPFARIAMLLDDETSSMAINSGEVENFAIALLDEIDLREGRDVTPSTDAAELPLLPRQVIRSIPVDQLRRLVTALFDAADSLSIYSRTGALRSRNPNA